LVLAYERTYRFDWLVLMDYFLGSFCRVFRWIFCVFGLEKDRMQAVDKSIDVR
jgi:hypothetical protein